MRLALFALPAFLTLGLALAPDPAEGQGGNSATFYVVQARVPRPTPPAAALLRFGKQNHRTTLQEVTDVPLAERSWLARLIVQFARPLNDWEYSIQFFQIEGSQREAIGSPMSIHVSDKNEKLFLQPIELKRPDFQPGTKVELVLRVRGATAGKRTVNLAGERVRVERSGEVDFTR